LFTAQLERRGSVFLTYNLSYYTPYVRVRLWSRQVDSHLDHPALIGFVGRARTYVAGLKSRMLGAWVLPNNYPHIPSLPYLDVHTFQPVRHFPGSQCLVLKPTRLLSTLCY
jgi:hypothetical protein